MANQSDPRAASQGPTDGLGGRPRDRDEVSLTRWRSHAAVSDLVAGLSLALGDKLRGVLLYGPAARGESTAGESELHLLVVMADLELDTLAAAGPALGRWIGGGRAMPRLFTPATLRAAADVFPVELGEIAERHLVLHGRDPLTALPRIHLEHLRLQVERELREKMMRLQETYALCRGKDSEVARLVVGSYPAFALVFRGCLRLHGDAPPDSSLGTAEAFCRHAGIDPAPFDEAERLRRGEQVGSLAELFARYYTALDRAVEAVDRFVPSST